jgi:hypothetical protein
MCHPFPAAPGAVWHVDFEFSTHEDGSLHRPFLMAAHCHTTGRTLVLWGADLTGRDAPPFAVGPHTYIVAHYCRAEAACFRWLGWPQPNFVDTALEYRLSPAYADQREALAIRKQSGHSSRNDRDHLLGLKLNEMARGLGVPPLYDDAEKEALQRLAATGGPFNPDQQRRLIDYCIADTLMTRRCLPSLIARPGDWAAAAIRADFALVCERIRVRGVPVQVNDLQDLIDHRTELRERVIQEWDRFHLFCDGSFSNRAFVALLARQGWAWPYHEDSGQPDLRRETFREQSRISPVFAEIGQLRETVAMFKSMALKIDQDGRLRTDLRPFASKTGRSQPGGSSCLFLLPKFMRKFVAPPPGLAIVQGDYGQQEVLIAASLSGDDALLRAYREEDCYVGLGKQLGLIPPEGTRETHPAERNRCKPLLLGLLYRMSAEGLTARLKVSSPEGRILHQRLHRTFATYFAWSEGIVTTTRAGHPLTTPLGWTLHPRYHADSSRTRVNFLIQAGASDILRAACLLAEERGLELIMTVHDSLILQGSEMTIEETKQILSDVMREAATLVLGDVGKVMRVDLEITPSEQSPRLDSVHESKYRDVQRWLQEVKQSTPLVA